ncbi:PEP-CTERM sorting domain-containing protein [Nitrosomonas sp.]|uniref:PEP-CTERM sorting domain-containing protein n=1 Tax=Nitrosomonas sp. TaxID=42353 RepID=UPI0026293C12|nr:PEP-CTERM sorting domain-containing protein [Nitrosomonas sp.]
MNNILSHSTSFASASMLALILGLSATTVYSTPFTITAQLTGDPRPSNPDNLIVDVKITGDTTSNTTFWTFDINSPLHSDIKLHEFYFNLTGLATDYSFGGFNPIGWAVESPADNAAGSGGADFLFKSLDQPGPPNAADVTNTQDLTFTATRLTGNWDPTIFLNASNAISNDTVLGEGQLGAHLQSLTCTFAGCSDSGFAFGGYETVDPPRETPEPATLALLGLGLAGLGWSRRRKN